MANLFPGSIPGPLAQIVHEHTGIWRRAGVEEIHVGCSGNFTVERVLADHGFRFHGCDVQFYSAAIGSYFAGKRMKWDLVEDYEEQLGWLRPWLDGRPPPERLATMMLTASLTLAVGNPDNAWYSRQMAATKAQWERMHAETTAKIKAARVKLESFKAMDVIEQFKTLPDDVAVISYPPFMGWATAHPRKFSKLGDIFGWRPPPMHPLDEEHLLELFGIMRQKAYWAFATNWQVPGFGDRLVGAVHGTNRGDQIWVYCSHGPTRVVSPHQKIDRIKAPSLGPADDLGDRMQIAPLTDGQFAMLRSHYMNPGIRPGSAPIALAVLVDGVIVGAFAISVESPYSSISSTTSRPATSTRRATPATPAGCPCGPCSTPSRSPRPSPVCSSRRSSA